MEQTLDEKTATNRIKKRNGFIALILSLFLPGLGQIYNGQAKKAFLFFSLFLILPLLFGQTRLITFFYGFITLFIIELILRVYVIIDSVKTARRLNEYVLKPFNTWYYHLLIATGMLAISIIFDTRTLLGIQTFKIPTTANNPILQAGDWAVADMRAYENKLPEYGDIVVYLMADGSYYNFRVVGRPKDLIEINNNVVSINGRKSGVNFIGEMVNENMPVLAFEERFPNGHTHVIYTFKQPYDSTKTNIKNIAVPTGYYFLLGDNRDNAVDSRYVGFIHKDQIEGQIIYSYWGAKGVKRMNVDFRGK